MDRTALPTQRTYRRRRAVAAAVALSLLAGTGAAVVAVTGSAGAQQEPTPDADLPTDVAAQIAAVQAEKDGRSADEAKVDSNLLYAANEEAGEPAVEGAPALTSSVDVDPAGRTEVDITADVDGALLEQIEDLGGRVVESTPGFDSVRALLPVEAVVELAGDDDVRTIEPAAEAHTNQAQASGAGSQGQGAATNQAILTHGVDDVRTRFGVDGAGAKACVLSDGVDTMAGRQATGDLPVVDILPGQAGSGDEGTAMLELIHDMAPGAELGFATAFGSQAGFAQNIIDLRADGCDVIVDDVTYYTEGAFQDDDIARAISQVRADGAVYFTSAGNSGNLADGTSGTWQGDFQDAGASQAPLPTGLRVHGWGAGVTSNPLTGGYMQPVTLQWADPLNASRNDYDLFVLNAAGTSIVKASTTRQTGTQDPYERVDANAGQRVVVAKAASAAPRYLAVYTNRGLLQHATGGAAYGHNASVDAVSAAATPAVASIDQTQPGPYPGRHNAENVTETFSSDGPARSFYAADGTPLTSDMTSAGGVVRNGVDLTAADGTSTTAPMFRTFYGTSAAAPNLASLAVLAVGADPTLTPDEVEAALRSAAVDIEAAGDDPVTGGGIPLAPAVMEAVGIDDAALVQPGERTVTEVRGDADDVYEPGEIFRVTQDLTNWGGQPATGVTATLGSTSPSVAITTAQATYGTIASGATTGPQSGFTFRIRQTCLCGSEIPFTITTSYGGGFTGSRSTAFSVAVGSDGPATTGARAGAPLAIPDLTTNGAAPNPVSTTIEVGASTGPIRDLTVTFGGSTCSTTVGSTAVGLDHSFVGDLEMILTSPAGTTVALTTKTANSGNNLCKTTFSDSAPATFRTVAANAAPFTGSYRPASPLAAFDGEDPQGTWTLRLSDNRKSDSGSLRDVSIDVTPASCEMLAANAPTARADALSTPYQTSLSVDDPGVLANDDDLLGEGLGATVVDDVDHGTLELASDGTLAYTPDAGFSGQDSFRYTAQDGDRTSSAPAVVTIDVGPAPNTAPVVQADAYDTAHQQPLTVSAPGVLGNDGDADSDTLTATVLDGPTHGGLAMSPDGSFTYTPAPGFSGEDVFSYTAGDGAAASDPATVTITVAEPTGPVPVATADAFSTPYRTAYDASAPGVLRNDAADTTGLEADLVDDAANGSVALSADGSFTYTPDRSFKGDDTFTYRMRLSGGRWSEPTPVTISVGKPASAAPAGRADAFDPRGGEQLLVRRPGLLANDVEPDGEAMTTVLVDDVEHGTLSLRLDGSFTYTPEPGFRGVDTFTYAARDARLRSAPVTVELHVSSLVDAFIDAAHRHFLGRPATEAEVEDWVIRIESGTETRATFVRDLTGRREHAVLQVGRTFQTYLDRSPEPEEEAYWTDRLMGGLPVSELSVLLLGSPAGVARTSAAPDSIVDAVFASVLDREPTETERARWVRSLGRGETIENMARNLNGSNAGRNRRATAIFLEVLGREPTPSELGLWAGRLATRDEVEVAIALAASVEYLESAEGTS